jgi:hypothetical protein
VNKPLLITADEPALVTADEVAGWFADASRKHVPTVGLHNLEVLVARVNAMRGLRHRARRDELLPWDEARVIQIQTALRDLHANLPWLLERNGWSAPNEPELPEADLLRRLADLLELAKLDELFAAGPYLFRPPARGRPRAQWHADADALVEPIEQAWKSAGRRKLSRKADGPLVRVLCRALAAIDGEEHTPAAVASALQRQRQRRDAK